VKMKGYVSSAVMAVAMVLILAVTFASGQENSVDLSAQDLYFVVDQSGSIKDNDSKCKADSEFDTCMELLADFANKTHVAMYNLIGSYFKSPQENGLRVGILMFRCKSRGQDPKVILRPTGNATLIRKGFERLFTQRANQRSTCAETALRGVQDFIANKTELEPPMRTSSICYVTDGFLEKKDREIAADLASGIRESNQTQFFGISIGKKNKAAQNEAITEITGDPNLIFDVQEPQALEGIVDSLSSFIFGDFRTQLISTNATSNICAGERPMLRVSGASVVGLENLECDFVFSGVPGIQTVTATPIGGGFDCRLPESFYSDPEEQERIEATLYNQESGGTRRRIGTVSTFLLDRPSCIEVSRADTPLPNGDRCLGTNMVYELTGETISGFLASSVQHNLRCRFRLTENGYEFTRTTAAVPEGDGQSYRCSLDDKSALHFRNQNPDVHDSLTIRDSGISSVDVFLPPVVNGVNLLVDVSNNNFDIPGTELKALAYTDIPTLRTQVDFESEHCFINDVSQSACWRRADQASADFSGPVVNWALDNENANLEVACLVSLREATGELYSYLVPRTVQGPDAVSCNLPEELVEPRDDGALTRLINVNLYLVHEQDQKALILSARNDTFTFTLSPCVTAAADREPCFGDGVTMTLESPNVAIEAGNDLECRFIDTNSELSVAGTSALVSGTSYTCTSVAFGDDTCPLSLDKFQLLSFGRVLLERELTSETTNCFNVRARSHEQVEFLALGSIPDKDISGCWAQPDGETGRLLFTGQTAQGLSNSVLECEFNGGWPVAGNITTRTIAVYDASLEGHVCEIPREAYFGEGNGVTSGFIVNLLYACVDAQDPRDVDVRVLQRDISVGLEVSTSSPCLETSIFEAGLPEAEGVVCIGSSLEVQVRGGSALLELTSSISSPSSFICEFGDSDETTTGQVTEGGNIICPLPLRASLPREKVASIRVPTSGGVEVAIPLGDYPLDTADSCLRETVVVDHQTAEGRRRALQTGNSLYCMGDSLSTGFAGTTIEQLLARFGNVSMQQTNTCAPVQESIEALDDWSCVWTIDPDFDSNGGNISTLAVLQPDSSILCESPIWNPFRPECQSAGTYSSLSLILTTPEAGNEIGDGVDLTVGYKAQVCADGADWGDVTASEAKCARDVVDLTLGGRSAITLGKRAEDVSCEFAGPSGIVRKSAVIDLDAPSVKCTAEGWRPDSPSTGNYTEARIVVIADDNSTIVVKRRTFDPTAELICIEVDVPSEICLGEGIEGQLIGASLSTFRRWHEQTNNGTLADVFCGGSAGSSVGDENTAICRFSDSFLDGSALRETLEIQIGGVSMVSNYNLEVQVSQNNNLCLEETYSFARCDSGNPSTTIEFAGSTVKDVEDPSATLRCVLLNTTSGTVETVIPEILADGDALVCQSSTASYNNFSVVLASELDFVVAEGAVELDNTTCAFTAVVPPTPSPTSDETNLGLILGPIFALLALLALIFLFVARRRRDDNEEDGTDLEKGVKKLDEDGPAAFSEPLLHNYGIGDRIEASGDFDGSGEVAWHKGEIVEMSDNDGTFTVHLDHISIDAARQVVKLTQIQKARSNFAVGDRVEARVGAGKVWHGATVERVNKNDTYDLAYDDAEPETHVAGSLIRKCVLHYRVGEMNIEGHHFDEKRHIRAKVMEVNVPQESYMIKFIRSFDDKQNGDDAFYVKASEVRPFSPIVGETVEVLPDGERAVVTSVDLKNQQVEVNNDEIVEFEKILRPVFAVGEFVEAQEDAAGQQQDSAVLAASEEEKVWLPGTVTEVSSQEKNLYTITFDESGKNEMNVPISRIRRAPGLYEQSDNAATSFSIGDNVEVLVSKKAAKEWQQAKITNFNANDGTYDILFTQTGKMEQRVPVSRIKVGPDSDPIPDIFRPPPREHEEVYDENGNPIPHHLRFKKQKPLEYRELPDNCFEIVVSTEHGLGVSLGFTSADEFAQSRIIVAGFRDLPSTGGFGPVEATGLVGLKDEVLAINGVSTEGRSFVEISEMIRSSKDIIRLKFGRWNDQPQFPVNLQPPKAPVLT